MIRASDLIGCVMETESGKRLGRIHDLRAEAVDDGWKLVGLVIGRGGLLARLTGSDTDPLIRGDVIPWRVVTGLENGLVTVRDDTEHGSVSPS